MATAKKKVARILVETEHEGVTYKPNQLVSFPAADAEALEKAGKVDTGKAAVEYCKGDGVEAVEHAPAAEAQAEPQADDEGELAE